MRFLAFLLVIGTTLQFIQPTDAGLSLAWLRNFDINPLAWVMRQDTKKALNKDMAGMILIKAACKASQPSLINALVLRKSQVNKQLARVYDGNKLYVISYFNNICRSHNIASSLSKRGTFTKGVFGRTVARLASKVGDALYDKIEVAAVDYSEKLADQAFEKIADIVSKNFPAKEATINTIAI